MAEKKYILTRQVADKKLRRMALQVAEQNCDAVQLILLGIKENGIVIAHKIRTYLLFQVIQEGSIYNSFVGHVA